MINKGDFIELEFTAREGGKIFDTTNQQVAKSIGYEKDVKPIKIVVGEGMVVKGLDDALVGKEIGKEYKINLKPPEAFGERKPELIKTFSVNAFKDKKMLKEGNLIFVEGLIAKIVKVSSGRAVLDFNHPLAGKEIEYDFKIIRKIEDKKEKVAIVLDYYGIKDYEIEIENEKIVVKTKNENIEIVEKILVKFFGNSNVEIVKL